MTNLYLPNVAKLHWLQCQIDELETLAGATLHLYKSGIIITPATTMAELEAVQATFPGYVPKGLVEWSNAILVDGKAITEADPVTWQATAASVGMLYGVYAVSGSGFGLLGVSPFTTPVPIPFTSELQVSIEIDLGSIFNL